MTSLGEFELVPQDDWRRWDVVHNDDVVLTVDYQTMRGIIARRYDVDALARGELQKATDTERISEQDDDAI